MAEQDIDTQWIRSADSTMEGPLAITFGRRRLPAYLIDDFLSLVVSCGELRPRVDVELGVRLFRHLMSLPLSYFESRRTGDTVARTREMDTVRNFLTDSRRMPGVPSTDVLMMKLESPVDIDRVA